MSTSKVFGARAAVRCVMPDCISCPIHATNTAPSSGPSPTSLVVCVLTCLINLVIWIYNFKQIFCALPLALKLARTQPCCLVHISVHTYSAPHVTAQDTGLPARGSACGAEVYKDNRQDKRSAAAMQLRKLLIKSFCHVLSMKASGWVSILGSYTEWSLCFCLPVTS